MMDDVVIGLGDLVIYIYMFALHKPGEDQFSVPLSQTIVSMAKVVSVGRA